VEVTREESKRNQMPQELLPDGLVTGGLGLTQAILLRPFRPRLRWEAVRMWEPWALSAQSLEGPWAEHSRCPEQGPRGAYVGGADEVDEVDGLWLSKTPSLQRSVGTAWAAAAAAAAEGAAADAVGAEVVEFGALSLGWSCLLSSQQECRFDFGSRSPD